MIKVCIVGCGKIADAHAFAISLIPEAEIIGVCDKEELMAQQLSDRFHIGRYFNDIHEMLKVTHPNVVHITTPPESHFELGRICLDAGCHVYIEKPFTIDRIGAAQLIKLADEKRLKLTVWTDEQYSDVAIRLRQLCKSGYLGGTPVHMEGYYGYDLGDERYARSLLTSKSHWVRSLPGQLMQNIISHGIAKIAEYLTGEKIRVIAQGFASNFLNKLGENDLVDELRVIITDENKTTAYFTFSSQMRPLLHEFRIFGPENGIIMNLDHHSLIKVPGKTYKSYLNTILPLNYYARQYRKSIYLNVKLFLKRDFHLKSGLRRLIALFYRSIIDNTPPPISYKEILLTTEIMDSIIAQVYGKERP